MNPKYTHDFSSASIKHLIEAEFYQKAGEALGILKSPGSIVTGPDFKRHIENYRKFIGKESIHLYEINIDIFIPIYTALKSEKKINVINNSIGNAGSRFIDCDLTCTSDLFAIQETLLTQIKDQRCDSYHNKVFIFSFGLRTISPCAKESYFTPILGLLGCEARQIKVHKSTPITGQGYGVYKHKVQIYGSKGRIKDYICYEYNAGGGPMLTCLLIYK